jgi:hypothetical protein
LCLCRKKCPPDEASKSQESRKRNGGRIKKEVLNPLYVYEHLAEEEEEENGVEDEEEEEEQEEEEQDIKLFLNLGSEDEQQTKRIIKTRWEFVCERLRKRDYFEKYRSPLASVAEPDPVSDLGFMTKYGNNLQLLKMPILTYYFIYLNEGLPSLTTYIKNMRFFFFFFFLAFLDPA